LLSGAGEVGELAVLGAGALEAEKVQSFLAIEAVAHRRLLLRLLLLSEPERVLHLLDRVLRVYQLRYK